MWLDYALNSKEGRNAPLMCHTSYFQRKICYVNQDDFFFRKKYY